MEESVSLILNPVASPVQTGSHIRTGCWPQQIQLNWCSIGQRGAVLSFPMLKEGRSTHIDPEIPTWWQTRGRRMDHYNRWKSGVHLEKWTRARSDDDISGKKRMHGEIWAGNCGGTETWNRFIVTDPPCSSIKFVDIFSHIQLPPMDLSRMRGHWRLQPTLRITCCFGSWNH